MKKIYEQPQVCIENVNVEKGFAVSKDFGLDDFEYDQDGTDSGNTAW